MKKQIQKLLSEKIKGETLEVLAKGFGIDLKREGSPAGWTNTDFYGKLQVSPEEGGLALVLYIGRNIIHFDQKGKISEKLPCEEMKFGLKIPYNELNKFREKY
ncbi:hypothetical protein J4474_02005 [Candidatus Pacearchaeota archaeon]|nr:hypothetical protein [Candidatus Pacearchaeota archaeon]